MSAKKVYSKAQIEDLKTQITYVYKTYLKKQYVQFLEHKLEDFPLSNTNILDLIATVLKYNSFSELKTVYSHSDSSELIFWGDIIPNNLQPIEDFLNKINKYEKDLCNLLSSCFQMFETYEDSFIITESWEELESPYIAQVLSLYGHYAAELKEKTYPTLILGESEELFGSKTKYSIAIASFKDKSLTPEFDNLEELELFIKENILKYRKYFVGYFGAEKGSEFNEVLFWQKS
jgi:hypothetical protein